MVGNLLLILLNALKLRYVWRTGSMDISIDMRLVFQNTSKKNEPDSVLAYIGFERGVRMLPSWSAHWLMKAPSFRSAFHAFCSKRGCETRR
jgi:hypothetical protein